ncbi:MAG: hypothetical protein ACREQ9_11455 [Candidatus Binatia bacterium]
MRATVSMLALAAMLLVVASAEAQEPPPLPESDVVCDNDTDTSTPANDNACDCAFPPDPANAGPSGCLAIGPVCLAGDIASLTGCLSISGAANVCSEGPGVIAQCDDDVCAATASAGCSAASPLPPPPV